MSIKNTVKYTRLLKSLNTVPHVESQHQSPLSFISTYLNKWKDSSIENEKNDKIENVKEGLSSNGAVRVKMNYDGQLLDVRLIKNKVSVDSIERKDLELWIQEASQRAWAQFREDGLKSAGFQEEHQWVFKDEKQQV